MVQQTSFVFFRRSRVLGCGVIAGLASLALPCVAVDSLPQPVIPAGVGINIHFTRGHEADLDAIAEVGVKVVRMDLRWDATETQEGVYDFSAYDELTEHLLHRGLRPLYILNYSNGLYEPASSVEGSDQLQIDSPRHPKSVEAYARWAAAAAGRYRGRGVIWEIWNEPNLNCWWPRPNVDDYMVLAERALAAIRAAAPDDLVIGPASSEFPWSFLSRVIDAGLARKFDAISVHPYRAHKEPETAEVDYARLRSMLDRALGGGAPPIISGEWGYSTVRTPSALTPEIQAAYLVRMQLGNVLFGIPVSVWYDWKNDGPDPEQTEHNFGLVNADLSPKPAYWALKTMTTLLSGFRVRERLPLGGRGDFVILWENDRQEQLITAWTVEKSSQVKLPGKLAARVRHVADMDGREASATVDRDGIQLTGKPVYISLDQVP